MNLGQWLTSSWTSRALLLLLALVVIPACGRRRTGAAGPPGAPGADGVDGADGADGAPGAGPTVVRHWSNPRNVSQLDFDHANWGNGNEDAESPQVVIDPTTGRVHVIFIKYDVVNDNGDELYYNFSDPPYATWGTPVRLTDGTDNNMSTPFDADITVGPNGQVHVAFARDNFNTGDEEIYHTFNTAAAPSTWVESLVHADNYVVAPRVQTRGNLGAVVFQTFSGGFYDTMYWQTGILANAGEVLTSVDVFNDVFNFDGDDGVYDLAKDAAGNLHLAVVVTGDLNALGDRRYVVHRSLDSAQTDPDEANWTGPDQLNNEETDDQENIDGYIPPIIRFDGSDNAYIFWFQDDVNDDDTIDALHMNIRTAAGAVGVAAFNITDPDDPTSPLEGNSDNWYIANGDPLGDLKVDSAGNVYVAWMNGNSYFSWPSNIYPVFYRSRAAGTLNVPAAGPWTAITTIGGTRDPFGNWWQSDPVMSVQPAPDGRVHVFWTGEDLFSTQFTAVHAYHDPTLDKWIGPQNVYQPTMTSIFSGFGQSIPGGFGIDADGNPFASWFAFQGTPNQTQTYSFVHTIFADGVWKAGVRVDASGVTAAAFNGFWIGQDDSGRPHAVWGERLDPFFNSDSVDMVHAYQP